MKEYIGFDFGVWIYLYMDYFSKGRIIGTKPCPV